MHNLELSEEQAMILDTVRKFVQDSVAPKALDLDEHRQFDREGLQGMAELGLLGLPVAEDRGGAGMGMLAYAIAVEEIARHSSSLARLLVVHAGQCGKALESLDGAADQLAAVMSGAQPAAFLGPEWGILSTDGKLTGTAELVVGAGEAKLLVVAAQQDPAPALFTVDAAAGKSTPIPSLGFAAAATARVEFQGVPGKLVAEGEAAVQAVRKAQAAGWIGSGALAVGTASASVAAAYKHASERVAFGKPLLRQPAVGRKLVEARRVAEAARHLVYHAARLIDSGADGWEAAISARLSAVEAAVLAADEAIQIHGGYGYTVEYHVERHYRDAMTLEVLDGGGEALREELARVQFAG